MQKLKYRKAAGLVLLGMSFLLLANCSAIGYHVGKAIDDSKRRPFHDVGMIRKGSYQTVNLKNNARVQGTFEGFDTMTTTSYYSQYDLLRRNSACVSKLPQIGETVVLKLKNGDSKMLEFGYFDYGSQTNLSPLSDTACEFYLFGNTKSNSTSQRIHFNMIDKLSPQGKTDFNGEQLLSHAKKGDIPLKSQMLIRNEDGDNFIPLSQVISFEPKEKGKAKWIGLGIGATLDAAVIALSIAAAIAFSQWDFGLAFP